MAINQSWLASLPNLAPIGEFEPLVSFHDRALVIGIGDSGAKIIELLSERLQDAQITAQHAQPRPVENQPEFLHIAFEEMPSCYQLQAPVMSFVLSEGITAPQNANNAPEWQWLTQNPLASNQRSRRSVRIALFRHLQMGEDAWLAQLLRQKLGNGINAVFIVASALEFAGANIIGDIAALVRSLATNMPVITALVALEDCANDDLRFAQNEVPHYQTAALYELQRWSSESHRYWRLGTLNYQTQGTNLIDRAIVCYGDRGIGLNRITQFIWAALTSQGFAAWVGQELRQGISLFYSRALQWHTRLLRNIYTERLVLALIGEDRPPANQLNIQGRNPNDRLQQLLNRLDQWLDSVRSAGLLPSLIGLQRHLQGTAAEYLNQLIAVFRRARAQAQQSLNQALSQLDKADREQELGYFLMPLLDGTWRTTEAPAEAIEALRERLGWVSSNLPDYPIRMAFQGQVQGTTAFIHQVAAAAMQQYVEKVRELAERVASQYVARQARELLANLATPAYRQFAQNWAGYYSRWQSGLDQYYDITARQPRLMIVALNEPSQDWRPPVAPNAFNSTDRAFALQAYIVHNVAINGLKITRNATGACRLFNTQQLVDSPEVLTFLYFGTLDVDLRLQNAIAEQELFKLFGECLVRDCYEDICDTFQLPRREQITDWLSVLETFMRRVQSRNYRQDVKYWIDSKERLPADQLANHLPSGSPEAEQLAKAISIALRLHEEA